MQHTSSAIWEDVAQQLGMRQEDLEQQSLRYFLEGRIQEVNAELAILKNKYQISSIEAFDQLYASGTIEESTSWRDYQQFDNLSFKNQSVARVVKGSGMMDINHLKIIAISEFPELISKIDIADFNQMRIFLQEGSFIEIWFSPRNNGRYSYHWERQQIDGTIYRHDNTPHLRWKNIPTFPKHFHEGTENQVTESHINDQPEDAIRTFLNFVKEKMQENTT